MLGKVVSKFSIDGTKPHEVTIDLADGVYILSAVSEGNHWKKQLVIAR
jgi:hypothetical protein